MQSKSIASRLSQYYQITWRKDTTETLQPTFFVMLKLQAFLPTLLDHNLSRNPESMNYYGYVLSRNHKSSDAYVKLGEDQDLRVAAVQNGQVTISNYDSRLLIRATPPENSPGMKLLYEFINDQPIADPKLQTLVRPRAHTRLESHGIKLNGLFIIMNMSHNKVTVAGFSSNFHIMEIEVDSDLLCEYKEPKEGKD